MSWSRSRHRSRVHEPLVPRVSTPTPPRKPLGPECSAHGQKVRPGRVAPYRPSNGQETRARVGRDGQSTPPPTARRTGPAMSTRRDKRGSARRALLVGHWHRLWEWSSKPPTLARWGEGVHLREGSPEAGPSVGSVVRQRQAAPLTTRLRPVHPARTPNPTADRPARHNRDSGLRAGVPTPDIHPAHVLPLMLRRGGEPGGRFRPGPREN